MTPSREYGHLYVPHPRKLTEGADQFVDEQVGKLRRKGRLKTKLLKEAQKIHKQCTQLNDLSDGEFDKQLEEQREKRRRFTNISRTQEREMLAAVGQAAYRSLGMLPYPVQFMGSLALVRGLLAEMATGEGKTLTVGVAGAYLAWRGYPLHLITANDYLAQRDEETMRPLYQRCRVQSSHVIGEMDPATRGKHYQCDMVYTTSQNLLADFLRDRLELGSLNDPTSCLINEITQEKQHTGKSTPNTVLRGIHTALVDEADSVLIDEAVTPLIISQKQENKSLEECCAIAHRIASKAQAGRDYKVNFKKRAVEFTVTGHSLVETHLHELPRMWRSPKRSEELVKQSLIAREFYKRDQDYVVQDDKVIIVDPSTGRLKPESSWKSGMHQAIEMKEGVPISQPAETLASLSFQNFFRLFRQLAGTTGTVGPAATEFWHVYRLTTICVPTNKPRIRKDYRSKYFVTENKKWDAIAHEAKNIHSTGRPILLGVQSVASSEKLATKLDEKGLEYELLNAARHEREAEIVSEAGLPGKITIATNMAGRGTDIKLDKGVKECGGLHVIGCERMESLRIDRQLYGRAGRQGDPGSSQTFVSLEDELHKKTLGKHLLGQASMALKSGSPLSHTIARYLTNTAQRKLEKKARQSRASVVKMDKWLDEALSFSGPKGI